MVQTTALRKARKSVAYVWGRAGEWSTSMRVRRVYENCIFLHIQKKRPRKYARPLEKSAIWCRGPESNWGHEDFQSTALPTELPRHFSQAPRLIRSTPLFVKGKKIPHSAKRSAVFFISHLSFHLCHYGTQHDTLVTVYLNEKWQMINAKCEIEKGKFFLHPLISSFLHPPFPNGPRVLLPGRRDHLH